MIRLTLLALAGFGAWRFLWAEHPGPAALKARALFAYLGNPYAFEDVWTEP